MSEVAQQTAAPDGVDEAFAPRMRNIFSWEHAKRAATPVALFAASAALSGSYFWHHETAETTIASHDATVSLRGDGYATVDFGAHEPTVRAATKAPLGIGDHIDVGTTDAKSMKELTQRYIAIAEQPKGEIASLTQTTEDLLLRVGLESGGIGLAVAAVWPLVGARRRRELAEKFNEGRARRRVGFIGAAVLLSGCTASSVSETAPDVTTPQWVSVAALYPDLKLDTSLQGVQVEANVITDKELDTGRGMIIGYQKSKHQYRKLEELATEVGPLLRQPQNGDEVALLVADRHDNIGMDPVDAAIGKAAHADTVIDLGDDTSDDQAWEKFSTNSLVATFKSFINKISVSGNHDHSGRASSWIKKAGWTVLAGKVKKFGRSRILGLPDPKASGMVNYDSFDSTSLDGQAKELADVACEADKKGERINVIAVHEEGAGALALAKGCVDAVISGHKHRFQGPTTVVGSNGDLGTNFVDNTAGAATIAMALGPQRRDAGVALMTTHNGIPIGIQKVTVSQSGVILPSKFEPLPQYATFYSADGTPLTAPKQKVEAKATAAPNPFKKTR